MDWLSNLLMPEGKFLGIEWHVWKVVGWLGNLTFFSRFVVQWYYTEKLKKVVIPVAFWWFSLAGASILFSYAAFHKKDSVFIFAYAFTFIPYIRNLIIHHRHLDTHVLCPGCQVESPPSARFCCDCGTRLPCESKPADAAA